MEIERKWRLKSLLPVDKFEYTKRTKIHQVYLGEGVRLRHSVSRGVDEYTMTVKNTTELDCVRDEYEVVIPNWVFYKMFNSITPKGSILKTRYEVIHNGIKIEIDVFELEEELILMEIEFPHVDDCMKFQLPDEFQPFVIEEVTSNTHYTNEYLAGIR